MLLDARLERREILPLAVASRDEDAPPADAFERLVAVISTIRTSAITHSGTSTQNRRISAPATASDVPARRQAIPSDSRA